MTPVNRSLIPSHPPVPVSSDVGRGPSHATRACERVSLAMLAVSTVRDQAIPNYSLWPVPRHACSINALRGFKPRLRRIACPSPCLQYQCPTINVEIDFSSWRKANRYDLHVNTPNSLSERLANNKKRITQRDVVVRYSPIRTPCEQQKSTHAT